MGDLYVGSPGASEAARAQRTSQDDDDDGGERGRQCPDGGSSLGGDVTAIRGTDGTIKFQLANLHGDMVATTAADLTTEPGLLTTTEYGTPRDPTTLGQRRYGWLGAKQRAADTCVPQLAVDIVGESGE